MVYKAPFDQIHELEKIFTARNIAQQAENIAATLPPCVRAKVSGVAGIKSQVQEEFVCPQLDQAASYLWTLSTPSSSNISPLHKQAIIGRTVCLTLEARLHLLWANGRMFVKPLPHYMLSTAFWENFLIPGKPDTSSEAVSAFASALGFLRTYTFLIQCPQDLAIAQQEHLQLVPKSISWEQWSNFAMHICNIDDKDVSGRYLYGEIRLSRLNLLAPLILQTSYYKYMHKQHFDRFVRLFAPFLFVFAIMATVLSAMQVAASTNLDGWVNPSSTLWPFFVWFSLISVFLGLGVFVFFIVFWSWVMCKEYTYSYMVYRRRERLLGQQTC